MRHLRTHVVFASVKEVMVFAVVCLSVSMITVKLPVNFCEILNFVLLYGYFMKWDLFGLQNLSD